MSLIVRFLSITAMLLIVGCNHSGATNTEDSEVTGGSTTTGGGIPPNTTAISFDETNAEGITIHIASRLNMLLAEIFRNLERLDTNLNADIHAPFAAATGNGGIVDPFEPNYCAGNGGGITGAEVIKYIDTSDAGTLSTFSSGDQIIFSYDAQGCILSDVTDMATAPDTVAGFAIFTFDGGSSVPPSPADRVFSGNVSFLNYAYTNGVLAHLGTDAETILSGDISFRVTFFGNGDTTAEFSSTSDVLLDGRSSTIGAITLRFPEVTPGTHAIERVINAGAADVRITNLVVTIANDQTSTIVNTIAYNPISGDPKLSANAGEEYPTSGALEFDSGTSSAIIYPEPNDFALATIDVDDGSQVLPVPVDWLHLIMAFLMPSFEVITP